MTNISYYKQWSQTKSSVKMPLDIFFDQIKDGTWQDVVLPEDALYKQAFLVFAKIELILYLPFDLVPSANQKPMNIHSSILKSFGDLNSIVDFISYSFSAIKTDSLKDIPAFR